MSQSEDTTTNLYAFRLFALRPSTTSKPSIANNQAPADHPSAVQHIKLTPNASLPSVDPAHPYHPTHPAAQTRSPQRPLHHYLAHPTETQRARYKAAAIEAHAVREWAERPYYGLRCEWRVVRLRRGADARVRRGERAEGTGAERAGGGAYGREAKGIGNEGQEGLRGGAGRDVHEAHEGRMRGRKIALDVGFGDAESQSQSPRRTAPSTADPPHQHKPLTRPRTRVGKKRRINFRIRLRTRLAEETAAAEEAARTIEAARLRFEKEMLAAAEKEEVLREKKRVVNRRKQGKKRERERARQEAGGGEAGGNAELMIESSHDGG